MAFPKRLLVEGEELILDLRPHPIALALPALVVIVGFAAATWVANMWDGTPVLIGWIAYGLVLLVFVVPKLIWWFTSNFVVTTDRVVHRQGFIAKRSMEIPLEAINDVRFEQGIFDRMVGAGSLSISSASERGTETFDDIRHPEEVQKTIYHQGELNKQRMYRGMGTPGPADDRAPGSVPPMPGGSGSPSAPSVTTELERLADLRAKGVLTEEEFQAQKAKILGQGGG
ncbi:MAG: PH domain-containing protein [Actinomycetota bacterium]